ncbi:MAG TPA: CocE/NonD family hydrolase [Gaiellaceae bacterium]|nr:CocE/NonD family hydrolase [Gaiellaceae bacterium]
MSTTIAHPTPAERGRAAAARVVAVLGTETGLARVALGALALHTVDDAFLQPNPGTSASDHLAGGLIPAALLLGTAWAYPRLRAGVRAALAFLFAFFGLLLSVEGFYYASKVGPSGDDYSSLLAAPAAFVLIGVGAVGLWKSRRTDDALWWRYPRRLLVTGGALVVVAVVALPLTVSYVVTHVGRADVATADLGAPYENVEFETSDGLTLKGWYIESKNGAAVISFPGRTSSQKRAKILADHGYGVLLFDRRGEGESEGDPNLLGWQGERDVHAAVKFLQSRPDVDPGRIGGIGLSVGGEMMIEAAAESNALKAIVSEGGSGRSVRDDLANPGGRWDETLGSAIVTAGTALSTSDTPPADLKSLVRKIDNPVFFVYGAKGQPAEKPANDEFYKVKRGPKEIWEVPGSRHMGGIEAQPAAYEKRVVGFFDRWLLKRSR